MFFCKPREGYGMREAFPQSGNGAIAEHGVARPTLAAFPSHARRSAVPPFAHAHSSAALRNAFGGVP